MCRLFFPSSIPWTDWSFSIEGPVATPGLGTNVGSPSGLADPATGWFSILNDVPREGPKGTDGCDVRASNRVRGVDSLGPKGGNVVEIGPPETPISDPDICRGCMLCVCGVDTFSCRWSICSGRMCCCMAPPGDWETSDAGTAVVSFRAGLRCVSVSVDGYCSPGFSRAKRRLSVSAFVGRPRFFRFSGGGSSVRRGIGTGGRASGGT